MKKTAIISAFSAALALVSNAQATDVSEMEKCVVMKDGKNIIKPQSCDCNTSKYSCAGSNNANDPEAWIFVPKGECKKINQGDFSGVSQAIKDKIEGAE